MIMAIRRKGVHHMFVRYLHWHFRRRIVYQLAMGYGMFVFAAIEGIRFAALDDVEDLELAVLLLGCGLTWLLYPMLFWALRNASVRRQRPDAVRWPWLE